MYMTSLVISILKKRNEKHSIFLIYLDILEGDPPKSVRRVQTAQNKSELKGLADDK